MITITLMGGLGNQIFQWALGRAFEQRGQQVQFDTSELDGNPSRRYMLGDLGLTPPLCKGSDAPLTNEGSLRFQPHILQLKGNHRLRGYFQSESYFKDVPIREEIFGRKSGKPVLSFSDKSSEVAQRILAAGEISCFVHFRRTDNLLPHKLRWHGLTSAEGCQYYERAVDLICERVKHPQFFVFSDDKEYLRTGPWVSIFTKRGLVPTMVDHNPMSGTLRPDFEIDVNSNGKECEDLWLMSLCRNAIIANSSFSWWGAWLSDSEVKVKVLHHNPDRLAAAARDECDVAIIRPDDYRTVIAPLEWFATAELDSMDICPERWERVSLK